MAMEDPGLASAVDSAEGDMVQQVDTAIAAARGAVAELHELDGRFREKMVTVLNAVVAAWQQSAGQRQAKERPELPHRWKHFTKLSNSSPYKQARAAAYKAMDALLKLLYVAVPSTQRSLKHREDPQKRKRDNELTAQRRQDAKDGGQAGLDRLWREYDELEAAGVCFDIFGAPLQPVVVTDEMRQGQEERRRRRIEELLVREAELHTDRFTMDGLLVADVIEEEKQGAVVYNRIGLV